MSVQLSAAQTELAAAFQAQAEQTTIYIVKHRARAYAERPIDLDVISPGLSSAAPQKLIAVGADLFCRETQIQRRWFGFGGEVAILNAQALILLGRTIRRPAAR